MPEPPQLTPFDAEEQRPPSSLRMSELLTLSLRLSPATLWRKLISAACVCDLVLSVTTPRSAPPSLRPWFSTRKTVECSLRVGTELLSEAEFRSQSISGSCSRVGMATETRYHYGTGSRTTGTYGTESKRIFRFLISVLEMFLFFILFF